MSRQKLIEAAARVYGEFGFRGATTRRIAEEAGVNEVTIFRHFGSKDALIQEVIRCVSLHESGVALPEVPEHPERELTEWATAHLHALRGQRAFIRKTMGEMEERPEVACTASEGSGHKARGLKTYMNRLAEHGFVRWNVSARDGRDELAHAAGAMLMGALFADAMGRDMLPDMYPHPPERAAEMYVKLFLRAIDCRATAAPGRGRRNGRDGRNGRPAAARKGTRKGTRNGAPKAARKAAGKPAPAVSRRSRS